MFWTARLRYNNAPMPKYCGELGGPPGFTMEGGRASFDSFIVGQTEFKKLIAANVPLADEIIENVRPGDRICIWVYGHLSHRKGLIGVKKEGGGFYCIPSKGFAAGMFWYLVISPAFVGLAGFFVGGLVGSLGGRNPSIVGALLGLAYGVGISWFTAYRFRSAYQEMKRG